MKEYKINKKLEKEDSLIARHIYRKILHFIITPYYFFLEYTCRKKIWKNFIMHDMIVNDNVIELLDNQNFGLIGDRFVKKELLDDPEKEDYENIYNFKDMNKVQELVSRDYREFFYNIFKKYFVTDVENYVNVYSYTEVAVAYDNNEDKYYREPIYVVVCQYWRELDFQKEKKNLKYWLLIFFILIILILILIIFI